MPEFPNAPAGSAEVSTGPRISVVIVVRNQAQALRTCVASLQRSTNFKEMEILVVDKASQDGSAEVDDQFPEVQILRLPKDFGTTRALNIGVRTARGEFLFLLHADSEVEPDSVAKLADRLGEDMTVGGVTPYLEKWHPLPTSDDLGAFCNTDEFPRHSSAPPDPPAEYVVEFPRDAPLMVRKAFVVSMNCPPLPLA